MRKFFIFLLAVFFTSGFMLSQNMSRPVKVYDSPLHASKWVQVAMGYLGKVHIVWEEDYSDSGGSDIFYMSYDGEIWEGPIKLKDSRLINAERPYICTGLDGSVYAVWDQDGEVYMRGFDPELNEWLPDERVASSDYGADEPNCAADPDGNPYFMWHNYNTGSAYTRAKIDGKWESIKRMNGALRSTQTGIAAGPDGQVWAIFREKQGDGEYKIYYTKRTKDTNWINSKQMNWGGASQTHPHIAVGPDNVPIVTYTDIDDNHNAEVWICTIDENGNPRNLVNPQFNHYPRVAVDSLGNIHVAWQIGSGDGGNGIMYTNNINMGEGQWRNPRLMPESGGSPRLPGIYADGFENVALVWPSSSEGEKNPWFSSLYPVKISPPPPPPLPPTPPDPLPPINLDVDITARSLRRSPSVTYSLSWARNPENMAENVKGYNIYTIEDGGDFELLMALVPPTFSSSFTFSSMDKRIQFGISTVYEFETGLYIVDESESDIVIFGAIY